MTGRENDEQYTDQDAEPSLKAPGEEGPTGVTADGDEDSEPRDGATDS